MEQYNVTGMSCAACSARVEKAVSKVPGVTGCSVSLLTNSMGVEGTASEQDIIRAVEASGYGASKKGGAKETSGSGASDYEEMLRDKTTPLLKKRLIASLVLLIMFLNSSRTISSLQLMYASNSSLLGLVVDREPPQNISQGGSLPSSAILSSSPVPPVWT